MNSPAKNEKPPDSESKLLNLDSDLPLTPEDFRAMKRAPRGRHPDLAAYIAWLEEIGAFKTRKPDPKIYTERFEL